LSRVDFSVLIGARRTSWATGQSVNGTHLLLTVARALSRLFHNADNLWLPKFTVRLVSWGGADVGDRGMTEFIEVFTCSLHFTLIIIIINGHSNLMKGHISPMHMNISVVCSLKTLCINGCKIS